MKKVALFCAVAAMAFAATAGDGLKFKFSSSGDTYADGETVQNGEVYALVWVAEKASFAGFNADGSLVDEVNNSLEAVSVAQGGGCITTVFIVDEGKPAGEYYMYLLDTRVAVADENGKVTKTATGLVDGKITVVSEAIEVKNVDFNRSLAGTETDSVDGTGAASVAAAIDPATVAQPVVSGFTLTGDGGAVLTVSGTVPYVQYTVYGGTSVTGFGSEPLASFLNGKASGDLELKVKDVGDCKFFKVVTK